jgi:hypothetical protein
MLRGQYSYATPSSIKQGHAEVQNEWNEGKSLVGIWFDDDFLELLGVKKPAAKGWTKKARIF